MSSVQRGRADLAHRTRWPTVPLWLLGDEARLAEFAALQGALANIGRE